MHLPFNFLTFYAGNLFFVFYKTAVQFWGNAKQNPGCIAVTAIQNMKSIFSLGLVTQVFMFRAVGVSNVFGS